MDFEQIGNNFCAGIWRMWWKCCEFAVLVLSCNSTLSYKTDSCWKFEKKLNSFYPLYWWYHPSQKWMINLNIFVVSGLSTRDRLFWKWNTQPTPTEPPLSHRTPQSERISNSYLLSIYEYLGVLRICRKRKNTNWFSSSTSTFDSCVLFLFYFFCR